MYLYSLDVNPCNSVFDFVTSASSLLLLEDFSSQLFFTLINKFLSVHSVSKMVCFKSFFMFRILSVVNTTKLRAFTMPSCMCVCMYVCVHVCTYKVVQIWPGLLVCNSGDISPGNIWTIFYVCVYVCMYMRLYVRVYVRIHVCMYVFMFVCVCVCMHVCIHLCMYVYVCMYVRMHVCKYVCMYFIIILIEHAPLHLLHYMLPLFEQFNFTRFTRLSNHHPFSHSIAQHLFR